jgi:hypothetical protein
MDDNSFKRVTKVNNIKDLEQEIAFELAFFEAIAQSDNFEIIPVPTLDGKRLTDEEKSLIIANARRYKSKILYRVSLGPIAVVFDEATGKTGIVPEGSDLGFYC